MEDWVYYVLDYVRDESTLLSLLQTCQDIYDYFTDDRIHRIIYTHAQSKYFWILWHIVRPR